jgi:glucokinase
LLKRFSKFLKTILMTDSIALGVDIGGSHITAGLVDLESRTILDHSIKRLKVKSDDTCENIITAWSQLILEVIHSQPQRLAKIGIALPGPFDYENGISYITGLEKYEALYGKNVKELLAAKLNIPTTSLRLKNDAGCFLQGEIFAGNARGSDRSIGLTIGTGIGTAKAADGIAEDADLWKTPFKDSIAENYLSTRWFLKRYKELTGNQVGDVKQLCDLLHADPNVQVVFNEFAENLTSFLTFFIEEENPEVIIIGGNIANASNLFFPQVIENLAKKSITIPLRKSTLGESAVLLGSASLWQEHLILER